MIASASARPFDHGLLVAVLALTGACVQSEDHGAWRAELFTERADESPRNTRFEETIVDLNGCEGIAAPDRRI
ncbi:MAG: hypothetical protein H6722_35085 [Sandaracinus sp.]|nr:hypothetical protein [Sandaracinus sp.]